MIPVADQRALRDAFGCFPSGVTAICALVDGMPVGMAASSFTSVSVNPPLLSVCVQNSSETWPKLCAVPRLGISVLGAGQDLACRQLAAKSGDRFAGLGWAASKDGAVYLREAAGWFECTLTRRIAAGDHEIALLQVESFQAEPSVSPLVFHASRFRQLAIV
jgi:flavin reductase (DIM6/NTAB) family NADH-FMN oxidoreductase RutF